MVGSSLFFLASLLLVASMGFAQDPSEYNCLEDFSTQPEAQEFFEANNPEDDPYLLDEDDEEDDGIACESLPGGDNGGAAAPDDDDTSLPEDRPAPEESDSSMSGAQYKEEEIVTPDTGGPALLPLAGAIILLGGSGYLFIRR